MEAFQQHPAPRDDLRAADDASFRAFIDTVRDYAMFMLDPTGRVISWNRGAQIIKGYSAEEIVGRHFSVFYPPAAIEQKLPQHELVTAEKDGRFEASLENCNYITAPSNATCTPRRFRRGVLARIDRAGSTGMRTFCASASNATVPHRRSFTASWRRAAAAAAGRSSASTSAGCARNSRCLPVVRVDR